MNKIILIIFALFSPFLLNAQVKKAVNYKLKTVKEYEQKWDKGIAGKNYPESLVSYDQKGNITEEIEYKAGKITRHFTYKYDSFNNKIEETELDPSGKKIKVSVYAYDTNNLRTMKTVYDGNNKILSKKTYQYETW
jgi:hypothetical protein